VHYTTVSGAIKKIEGKMKSDIARPDPRILQDIKRDSCCKKDS